MKTTILALAILSMFVAACAPTVQTGRAVFLITDAAADMGAVSKVEVTVDSVQAHNDAQGWVTVSSEQKKYDLLALKADGKTALMGDVQLKEGTYQQVRLVISKVTITDENGTHDAKLPSGELKINTDLTVAANTTSALTFDFAADESLHTTGDGKYILAPVIQVESRDHATVDASDKTDVEVRGSVKSSTKVGMDVAGNIGVGLGIKADDALTIDGGAIKIGGKSNSTGKVKVEV